MDVGNLNGPDRNAKKKLKKSVCNANISQFSIETYFVWFSIIIFITELIVGKLFPLKNHQIPAHNLKVDISIVYVFMC